jgi:glycosyltransferase involved in cell wall biosynthesis
MAEAKKSMNPMPEHFPSLHILGGRQFGGADQFYVRLVRALHEAGEKVTAVNRRNTPVARELAGDGIEQVHLPMANGWDLWSAWRIRKLVESREPCIVQTYMGRATRLTRLPKRAPAVHIARLGGYYKIDGYYRHAHAWIGNTRGICDYLVREGLPADRVFHIGNFVPDAIGLSGEEKARLRQSHGIPDDARVLLALGRLIGKKGFDDLLHALARLPAEAGGRPWIALLLGDGPLAGELRKLASDLGLDGRVRWLGWQNPPDPFYALADAFVCPSREEPLGNVILEAWNYGLPVVSTMTTGALELIEEGVTGLLCPLAEPAALAERIGEVLNSEEGQRRSLGETGRQVLTARFGRAAILKAYLELYGRLMAERGLG